MIGIAALLHDIVVQEKNGVLTVGDFMTRREDLHVVKPTTTVDEGICCICMR